MSASATQEEVVTLESVKDYYGKVQYPLYHVILFRINGRLRAWRVV